MNKIKRLRKISGLSIYDIAEKTDLAAGYISNLENGHKTNPSKNVMEKIANALNETVQTVFFPEDLENKKEVS